MKQETKNKRETSAKRKRLEASDGQDHGQKRPCSNEEQRRIRYATLKSFIIPNATLPTALQENVRENSM